MSRLTHVTSGPYAPPVAGCELTAVSADGSRIHVEVHGPEGAPAVVLSHGWTCSIAFWAAQIRALAADHRVIAYDQRGHGRSPAPAGPSGYTVTALTEDLEAVLAAALAPGERAVVAGHSMGGMTIMAAARGGGFREHVAAALLCSTGSSRLIAESRVAPLRPGALRDRITRSLLGARLPLGPVTPLSRRILRYGTMGPGSTREQIDACSRIVHACPTRVRHGWSHVLATLDVDAGVRELTVPTAVMAGSADRLTPAVHARRITGALPLSEGLTELPGLGHMTPVEAPGAVTARIRELVSTYVQVKGAASA